MREKLINYIDKYDISQADMARLLGVSRQHLNNIIKGRKEPGHKIANKFFELPGIKEKEQLLDVMHYLMLEFSRGNLDNEILSEAISRTDIDSHSLSDARKKNPQD